MSKVRVIDNEINREQIGTRFAHPSLIYDVKAGMLKFGEDAWVSGYFEGMVVALNNVGATGHVQDLRYTNLDGLSQEDVDLIYRYCLEFSSNGEMLDRLFHAESPEKYKECIDLIKFYIDK